MVLHQETTDANEDPLRDDEVLIIQGALEMRNKTVEDDYTPLDSVYMLDINRKLDKATMKEISEKGHSRVPVYDGDRENIVGLLFVKSLIMVDPDDDTPIGNVYKEKSFLTAATTVPLFDLMDRFQTGKSHLCVVHKTQINEGSQVISRVVGIITLEDVLESLIQEEILDEADITRDRELLRKVSVAKAKIQRMRSVETRGPQNPISRSAEEFSSRGDRLVSDTSPLLSQSSDN